ncbi:MAG TPA: hypothetical protein VE713_14935 [Pyrinomonadaceae bacterium]|nr:hypothetical protein [Pyrinomonadaceae bacterium]
MPEENSEPSPKAEAGPLTLEELIRSQLQGKVRALERYDAILWKIRSGYVVVLYGALTILGGKDYRLAEGLGVNTLLVLIAVVSISAFFVDLGFLLSKLRVVEARNSLSDMAFELARGDLKADDLHEKKVEELRRLLHLSGEAPILPS